MISWNQRNESASRGQRSAPSAPKKQLLSRLSRVAGVIAIVSGLSIPARAVSFYFMGQITTKSDSAGVLGDGFAVGSSFTGYIAFDPTAAGRDLYPAQPGKSLYPFNTPGSFVLNVTDGAHSFAVSLAYINVLLGPPAGPGPEALAYSGIARSYDGVDLPRTFTSGSYGLTLYNAVGPFHVLSSDSLPTFIPNASDFSNRWLGIHDQDPTRGVGFDVQGSVTQITAIPEPCAPFLLFIGAIGLLGLRRGMAGRGWIVGLWGRSVL